MNKRIAIVCLAVALLAMLAHAAGLPAGTARPDPDDPDPRREGSVVPPSAAVGAMNKRIAIACLAVALLAMLAHAAGLPTAAAAPSAIVAVLLTPGAAVLAAALEWRPALDPARCACLTVAASMSSEALIGLALYAVNVRIGPGSLTIANLIYVGGLVATTFLRERTALRAATTEVPTANSCPTPTRLLVGIGCGVAACAIVSAAIIVARHGALDQPYPGFSTFVIVRGGTADLVTLDVTNHEGVRASYRLESSRAGAGPHGGDTFTLAAGQTAARTIPRPRGEACREVTLVVEARAHAAALHLCVAPGAGVS